MLAISSAIIVLKPDTEPEWPTFSRLFEIGMATAVMVAYALFLKEYGFVACTSFRVSTHSFSASDMKAMPERSSLSRLNLSMTTPAKSLMSIKPPTITKTMKKVAATAGLSPGAGVIALSRPRARIALCAICDQP